MTESDAWKCDDLLALGLVMGVGRIRIPMPRFVVGMFWVLVDYHSCWTYEKRGEERREGAEREKKGFETHRFRTMRDDVKTYFALVLGGMEGRKEGRREGRKEGKTTCDTSCMVHISRARVAVIYLRVYGTVLHSTAQYTVSYPSPRA